MPTSSIALKIKKPASPTHTRRVRKTVALKTTAHAAQTLEEKTVKDEPKFHSIESKIPIKGYYRAIGRRKEATARVRMMETGSGKITVNGRSFETYFPLAIIRDEITAPLKLVGQFDNHDYSIKVEGGGTQGQAGAVCHGFARVLLQWNAEFRMPLKKAGFLRRDPRAKERKKFGLKGARRAPQWAKR